MAKKTSQDDIVEMVVNAWKSSWDYRESSYHKKWQDWYKLYNSDRVLVGYNGISDTFVPMSYGIIESLVSATSGEKPLVEYVPTRFDQNEETTVLNDMYSFFWDLDNWTNKEIQHSRNYFLYGTSVKHYYWDIDHPVMNVIPLRDFFCSPMSTIYNYQKAPFMGHRFLSSSGALKDEKIIDPQTGELAPKYKNLDRLSGTSGTGEQTDKEQKDNWMGSTLTGQERKQQVEVICYETLDKVYYIGNRQEVIYETDNYFKARQQSLAHPNPTGMFSYVVDANDPDESLLYGRSSLQPVMKPQELLNDITNQNLDAVSWALDPVMELDPMYASYIDKMKNVTGAIYPFKPGSYAAVNKPQIPQGAFSERVNIKNEIREATAIDQIIRGVATTGDTTATEVKAQMNNAGRRFDLVVSQLENGGYYQQAKIIFQMIQMYVTAPMMFRVVGEKGIDWQQFDPEMFKGDYEPRIKLKATLEREKTVKMRDLKEFYSSMLGNPFIKQDQLTKLIVRKAFNLEPDEAETLINNDQQGPPAPAKGQSPEDIALAAVGKAYGKGAPPDIEAQLEHIAGLQPSDQHPHTAETNMMQAGADQATALGTAAPDGLLAGVGAPPQNPQAVGVPAGAPSGGPSGP